MRQRGQVVYELIVNKGAARVDYLFRDNEACKSILNLASFACRFFFFYFMELKTIVFLSLYSSSFEQSHNTSHNSRVYQENKGSNHESQK